jgi:hypothetical protein
MVGEEARGATRWARDIAGGVRHQVPRTLTSLCSFHVVVSVLEPWILVG